MNGSFEQPGHATMSDLFRAKIAKLPAMPAELMSLDEEVEEEEGEGDYGCFDNNEIMLHDDSSGSSASSASSTATIRAPSVYARPELCASRSLLSLQMIDSRADIEPW